MYRAWSSRGIYLNDWKLAGEEYCQQKKITKTDAILEALHIGVRKALRQEQTDNTDGMDICLCKIEQNDLGADISFMGEKSPLYLSTR